MHVEVTIGWTQSDRENGYSSFDGYKPGAKQHTETVTVEIPETASAEEVDWATLRLAEAAFEATNSPFPLTPGSPAAQIQSALQARGFNGSQSGHYSLSVGDTVTFGEVTLACASFGWERVTPGVSI